MLEVLNSIDRAVFLLLNVTLANPVTDVIMPIITADLYLRILYGGTMAFLLVKGSPRLRWLVLFSAVVLVFTDQISAGFLKPLIERARPCRELSNINLLVGCGGGMSMPSSHAANAFGQAALFSLTVKSTRWYLWGIAGLIAISRVFVGVHYPGDVAVGAGIGIMTGISLVYMFRLLEGRLFLRVTERPSESPELEPAEEVAGRDNGRGSELHD